MAMVLDGYIRVSQTRGRSGETFISPKVQRDAIQGWADGRGVTIGAWHEDLDQSGGKLSRPGLDAMMARIHSGQTRGVAVAALDRFSRAGVADALRLVEEVHEAGATIAAVDLGIDPTTPVGEFSMTLMLALGRMQRQQFTEKWDKAQSEAIGRGIHFRAPFGYLKPGKGQAIIPDPETASLVVRAFELRAAGESWPKIAAYLNEHHAPKNAAYWTHSTVSHVVKNRAYLGEASHGKHVQPNAHPALVTAQLWEQANAVKGRAPSRGNGEGTLLSGIVRCAGCRRPMSPGETTNGRSEPMLTYRCRRNFGSGRCSAACAIKRDILESYVEQAFLERYADVEISGVTDTADLEAAQREVDDAEAELAAYRDNERIRETLSKLGDCSYEDGLATRTKRVLEARERLQEARTAAVGFDIPSAGVYGALTVPEKRRVLKAGIGTVFVRRSERHGGGRGSAPDPAERVLILWPREEPDGLSGRESADIPGVIPFDW